MYFVEVCFFNSKLADFSLSQTVGEVADLVELTETSKYSIVTQTKT